MLMASVRRTSGLTKCAYQQNLARPTQAITPRKGKGSVSVFAASLVLDSINPKKKKKNTFTKIGREPKEKVVVPMRSGFVLPLLLFAALTGKFNSVYSPLELTFSHPFSLCRRDAEHRNACARFSGGHTICKYLCYVIGHSLCDIFCNFFFNFSKTVASGVGFSVMNTAFLPY